MAMLTSHSLMTYERATPLTMIVIRGARTVTVSSETNATTIAKSRNAIGTCVSRMAPTTTLEKSAMLRVGITTSPITAAEFNIASTCAIASVIFDSRSVRYQFVRRCDTEY